jgi:hypothetical protein
LKIFPRHVIEIKEINITSPSVPSFTMRTPPLSLALCTTTPDAPNQQLFLEQPHISLIENQGT